MFTSAAAVVLDPDRKQALESLARAGPAPRSVARKCRVIFLASAGVPEPGARLQPGGLLNALPGF
jgi:hypothetical protein